MTPERKAEYHRTIDMLRRCAVAQSNPYVYSHRDIVTALHVMSLERLQALYQDTLRLRPTTIRERLLKLVDEEIIRKVQPLLPGA